MEQLKHFSHEHLLNLVQLQPDHDNANSDEEDEDEDEDKDDIAVEEVHVGECNICKNEQSPFYKYDCSVCLFDIIDIVCATMHEQKMDHQSHPHQLQRSFDRMMSRCKACGNEHSGTFYHCTSCSWFKIHLDCALLPAKLLIQQSTNESQGKTHIYFKVEDHPNLIRYPFPDESVNLVMHHFINKGEKAIKEKIAGEMFSHPHPLILVDTLPNGSISLHDPMKKVELLCDGCVRPITDVPFYKCCQQDCGFVLHEWCTRLPSEIQHHPCHHPEQKLVFVPKVPEDMLGVFRCKICHLHCNGFAYRCKECEYYYVDIHCGFIPDIITHEAHPNHLLKRFKASSETKYCKACNVFIYKEVGFHCPTCDFKMHIGCALLLPGRIRHNYDNHPLSLRYYPVCLVYAH
ncbi:hypothetical protein M8C21_008207 [Ambrosia artemisiifolia]|uniref:Phorbol-ester/DAG-type domain-containing protein n=1 Tax=Ambrosia artemisiifolia TaxID=4212 RepID=A0AAD5GZ80_AMBAR|nr:hypothetical protein M8C21_008207 [Ambrosia artemisiifolia]